MNTIEALHLFVGVILCGAFAALLSAPAFLKPPGINPMDNEEHYLRSFRNLLINISVYSLAGIIIGRAIEMLINSTSDIPVGNWYLSLLWVLLSVFVSTVGPKVFYTPPTNSIMRTTNYIFTDQRELPEDQGVVDNAVKYRGPKLAIINVFDEFQGFVETESRKNISKKIEQLRFRDDVGTGMFVTSFAITDVDAYAANGDTDAERLSKVTETITARLVSLIEKRTSRLDVLDVMAQSKEISEELTEMFTKELRKIEARLGISIQFVELSDINESEEHRKALAAIGVTTEVIKQAEMLLKMAKARGDDLSLNGAMELAIGLSQKGDMDIRRIGFEINAKGLENLQNVGLPPEMMELIKGKGTTPKEGGK